MVSSSVNTENWLPGQYCSHYPSRLVQFFNPSSDPAVCDVGPHKKSGRCKHLDNADKNTLTCQTKDTYEARVQTVSVTFRHLLFCQRWRTCLLKLFTNSDFFFTRNITSWKTLIWYIRTNIAINKESFLWQTKKSNHKKCRKKLVKIGGSLPCDIVVLVTSPDLFSTLRQRWQCLGSKQPLAWSTLVGIQLIRRYHAIPSIWNEKKATKKGHRAGSLKCMPSHAQRLTTLRHLLRTVPWLQNKMANLELLKNHARTLCHSFVLPVRENAHGISLLLHFDWLFSQDSDELRGKVSWSKGQIQVFWSRHESLFGQEPPQSATSKTKKSVP